MRAIWGRRGRLCAILSFVFSVECPVAPVGSLAALEIEQYFPVVAAGAQPRRETGWKIKYEILGTGNKYGGSNVWEIQSVEFMRGFKPPGEENWVKVLTNLA